MFAFGCPVGWDQMILSWGTLEKLNLVTATLVVGSKFWNWISLKFLGSKF
jgi:hypothetical protein